MAGGVFNFKSIFTADTEKLKQGAKEAKQAVQDFDDATSSALESATNVVGTSMGEIGKALSTVKGGLTVFSAAMKGVTEATSLSSKALQIFKIALASTGVGALIVGLGSLVAYFTKSQRGADQLAVIMGQVGQVFKTVTDYAISFGEKIVGFFTKAKDKALELIEATKSFFGKSSDVGPAERATETVFSKRKQLTKDQQQYERDRVDFITREAKLELEIAQQREIAADKANKTEAERLAANKKAQELLNTLYNERTALAQEALRLLQEDNSLSESMLADIEAERNLEKEILNLGAQKATQNKELLAQQAEITNQINAKAEAEKKAAAAALAARKKEDLTLEKIDSNKILNKPFEVKPLELPNKTELKEIQAFMVDTQDIARDFPNTVSDAFASMVEGLVTGELNMKDIFSTLLQFLAENLQAIGKALIAYGMAMEGFKKAISNPWVAIAAGAALVAAGAVLSGLIKNMNAGLSSGASASAAYSAATVGGGGSLDLTSVTQSNKQQSMNVKVSGTLVASGSTLKAVLKEQDKREFYTT